jgi:hypothetical protein
MAPIRARQVARGRVAIWLREVGARIAIASTGHDVALLSRIASSERRLSGSRDVF